MRAKKHQQTAADFEHISQEHHSAFGHGIGKNSNIGRQTNVADNKEELQKRSHPIGRIHLRQERNGGNQQGIVGQAREKLSAHNGIKTAIHE